MKTKATVKVEYTTTHVTQEGLGTFPKVTYKTEDVLVILPEPSGKFSPPVTALMQSKSVVTKLHHHGLSMDDLGDLVIIVSDYEDDGMLVSQWTFKCTASEIFSDHIFHNHLVPAAVESYESQEV